MKQKRARIVCVCCGEPGEHVGRGLVYHCYLRHHYRRTLDQFPRRPLNAPWIPTKQRGLETLARYGELVADNVSVREIRWELSLTERSFQRYAAAWRHLFGTEAAK